MSKEIALNPFIEYEAAHDFYMGGDHWTFKFANGFGASVVCNSVSYGGYEDLWELAVLNSEGKLDYSTSITNDVLGYLTDSEVVELLRKVATL